MAREGDAWVDFHANTDSVQGEAERGIKKAAEGVEDDFDEIGRDLGDTMATSMADELEKQGPELGKAVERGLGKQKVRTKVRVEYDKDNNILRRFVETTTEEIEDAFDKASAPGGPFSRIGRGIADAIGAGFNISGRSPLIALLIPLVGAIVGLVLAAVQAVNALVAVAATLPALLAGIGIQVGALAFAFHGMGEAISGAFAAKNAKELKEAIQGLTPAAQQFVRELLPIRDLFAEISKAAQQSFFSNLGSVLPLLQKTLGPEFMVGFTALAGTLGSLFRSIALFFASPTFVEFVRKLFPATIEFLKFFGPNLITFLEGLIKMSTAILPFLNTLGRMLGGTLFQLGDFFARISKSPDFQKWLDSMTVTLTLVLELLGGLIQFITVFMSELDKAGGAEIIQTLIDAVEILTFFLASEAGQKAMEGLVHLAIASIAAFTGLLIAILFVIGALEAFAEWFSGTAIPAIGEFFEWIGSHLMAFFTMVGGAIMGFFTMVGAGIREGLEAIKNFFVGLWNSVTGNIGNLLATAKALPSQLLAALGDLGSLLFNAGRNLISGFINGIKSMANTLINTVANLIGQAMSFFPGSPAEQGPLSGQGYSLNRGQRMMEDFARGIESEVPTVRDASSEAVSNIFFGRDSVRVAFEGALPTQEQAQQTGMAVGSGINSQLAARNTRLAVRTL